ncbi:hypothetical protein ACFLSW_05885 [Candidatus Bipolaricaulota bacterium]
MIVELQSFQLLGNFAWRTLDANMRALYYCPLEVIISRADLCER